MTRIQLCGRLSVEIDGAQLAGRLRGKQVPLLLAYLVLNRDRHVGRDELIGALWPSQAPVSQDAALRTLLSRLRSALGASTLAGRDELILTLPEPVWIDIEAAATEMTRALDALAQDDARRAWALAQVPLNIASRGLLPGTQASWLEAPRRELEEVHLLALEVIGRAGLVMGGTQLQSAERAARTLIESEPYRESGYVLLMEALATRGNVAEGLRVFDRLRTLLRDELGTSPSREAIAAHQRLVRPRGLAVESSADGDSGRTAGGRVAGDWVVIPLPAELRHRGQGPLIGRAAELAMLEEEWELACREARSGRLVLLAGDAGIGKTTLIADVARRVHEEGAIVLAGRSPRETVVAYQPILEALRHWALNTSVSDLRAAAREYGAELARLIPELRRRAPDLPPPADEPDTERYRLFEAVVGLMTELSRSTPVLLVLDDLQWADRPTLLLLRHLARATSPARVLILGAYRSTERGDTFNSALTEMMRERLATQLEIQGLSEADTAELVALRAGERPSRSFAHALYEETEGNPFFVEEIVRHLLEGGVRAGSATASELQSFGLPEGVKQVIAWRLSRLEPSAIELLRVASVIGRDVDAALLERVVLQAEEEFLGALEEALAAGLLVEADDRPGAYLFSHALIRETLYEGMSVPRRARIHKRVGEAIEATQGRRQGRYLPELAYHFTRAVADDQDAEEAITYALRAAEQATTMLAHEEAAEHYARALDVLARFQPEATARRCELLVALGEARVRGGERAQGSTAFREAAALAEQLGDGDLLARAAIGASRRYVQPPGVVDSELIAMIERALELQPDRTLVRVRLLSCLCGALYYSPERERMPALSQEAEEIAAELGDPEARAYACGAKRRVLWDPPHLQERVEASTEMLTLGRQIGNLELQLQAHAWLVVDLLERGDRDAVDAQMEAFKVGADRLRQPLFEWNVLLWEGMRALLTGSLDRADQLAAQALAAGGPAEAVTATQYYAIQLLAIRREQGRMGELEQAARRLVADNPSRPAWRAALANLLCEEGRLPEAEEEFERLAANDFEDVPRDLDWIIATTLLSDVCADLGDARRAALLYAMLEPYAEVNVVIGFAAVCLGSAASFLGKLAATMGQPELAAQHFERALAANAELAAPGCLARTQVDYARAILSFAEAPDPRADELLQAAALAAAERGFGAVARRAERLRTQLPEATAT
jgi:DNA-binding SARP family transcriptional activator/tetratricopeptide (TPR) repeat protein/ABC-type cobalamin/Fe3+-siderophores transport system ATPase subunit